MKRFDNGKLFLEAVKRFLLPELGLSVPEAWRA